MSARISNELRYESLKPMLLISALNKVTIMQYQPPVFGYQYRCRLYWNEVQVYYDLYKHNKVHD